MARIAGSESLSKQEKTGGKPPVFFCRRLGIGVKQRCHYYIELYDQVSFAIFAVVARFILHSGKSVIK